MGQDLFSASNPTPTKWDEATLDHFYDAALLGLAVLSDRSSAHRIRGSEADSRWNLVKGHLNDGDRIELSLRNAAFQFPSAFAPRSVFALQGLASDEPTGPDWKPRFGKDTGRRRWEEFAQLRPPTDAVTRIDDVTRIWQIEPEPLQLTRPLTPAESILVVGAGAVLGLAREFAALQATDERFDWSRQVAAVCESPGARQLAGLTGIFLESDDNCRVSAADETRVEPILKLLAIAPRPDRVVATNTPTDREAAFLDRLRNVAGR